FSFQPNVLKKESELRLHPNASKDRPDHYKRDKPPPEPIHPRHSLRKGPRRQAFLRGGRPKGPKRCLPQLYNAGSPLRAVGLPPKKDPGPVCRERPHRASQLEFSCSPEEGAMRVQPGQGCCSSRSSRGSTTGKGASGAPGPRGEGG